MSYLVHHFLEKNADTAPANEAVVHGRHQASYQEIENKANQVANWLLQAGTTKGDRVALLLRNSIEYIILYYGVLKAGAVVVPLNTGLDSMEIGQLIADCSAKILLTEKYFTDNLQELIEKKILPCQFMIMTDTNEYTPAEIATISLEDVYIQLSSRRPMVKIIDQDLASIIYTSGSTGKPKGVMLSHLNVVTNTKSIIAYLRIDSTDRCMVVLPFYYVYGKSLLNTHFAVGGTVVIDNRFTFPNAILKTMIDEKVTGFSGVPSTFSILLNKSSMATMNFPDLRYITQAGGHLSKDVKLKLLNIFSNKKIFIMYGATEASARLSYLPSNELIKSVKSIGKAIPNVQIKVMLENGQEAQPGIEGELAAKGSNIMVGYWENKEETKKVLKNGWYYTGDLGVQDEDGFFCVTGRKRDMIKVGIYKVSAIEIEEVLYQHPAVHEVAVVCMHDDILGEVPQAFVVLKQEQPEPDFAAFCASFLPDYKVPKQFITLTNLPKNESGKILKNNLSSEWS